MPAKTLYYLWHFVDMYDDPCYLVVSEILY